ncbi:hypothetical protein RUMTOR_00239 [[Ruminococcus] torques ATCC 27756]|uniref:Uncharacterized protein n=1 Tax=[Ruminococcus] torques ATCC 27756 TaxID=411460 RepID=A5KJ41_9FIRM|nr:hypothetical protein RUMTOR_00239 [[Ruminococcus] torques ATCC 27756]
MKSESISQLTGITLYFPVEAILLTSSCVGKTFILHTSDPEIITLLFVAILSEEFMGIKKTPLTEKNKSVKDESCT